MKNPNLKTLLQVHKYKNPHLKCKFPPKQRQSRLKIIIAQSH